MNETIIPRPEYLAALERHRVAPDLIKIVTGVRRCGKSTILKMYQEKDILIAKNRMDMENPGLIDLFRLK